MNDLSIDYEKYKSVWSVGFVNGRHRTRIAEYLGAEFIPVQVNKSEANALKKHLGRSEEHTSELQSPM